MMDMKEKYETLSLAVLKDVAKARGLKGTSTLKKSELIDRLLEEDSLSLHYRHGGQGTDVAKSKNCASV